MAGSPPHPKPNGSYRRIERAGGGAGTAVLFVSHPLRGRGRACAVREEAVGSRQNQGVGGASCLREIRWEFFSRRRRRRVRFRGRRMGRWCPGGGGGRLLRYQDSGAVAVAEAVGGESAGAGRDDAEIVRADEAGLGLGAFQGAFHANHVFNRGAFGDGNGEKTRRCGGPSYVSRAQR